MLARCIQRTYKTAQTAPSHKYYQVPQSGRRSAAALFLHPPLLEDAVEALVDEVRRQAADDLADMLLRLCLALVARGLAREVDREAEHREHRERDVRLLRAMRGALRERGEQRARDRWRRERRVLRERRALPAHEAQENLEDVVRLSHVRAQEALALRFLPDVRVARPGLEDRPDRRCLRSGR